MTKTLFFSAFMIFSFALIANGDPVVKTANVNVEASTIKWVGKKVTGSHEGTLKVKNGTLDFNDAGMLSGGEVIIDMTSMVCTDLSGGGATKLVGHLSSDDFFGIANHPTASIKITGVTKNKDGSYAVVGDATIKGITNPISFDAIMEGRSASATITVDRTQYDIKYGSGSFFDNLGDKTISDEFTLDVMLSF